MKLVVAIIRENQLDQVRESLIAAGIERITVSYGSGHGRSKSEEIYRGQKVIPHLIPNARLEIAVNDAFVPRSYLLKAGDKVVFIPPVAGG